MLCECPLCSKETPKGQVPSSIFVWSSLACRSSGCSCARMLYFRTLKKLGFCYESKRVSIGVRCPRQGASHWCYHRRSEMDHHLMSSFPHHNVLEGWKCVIRKTRPNRRSWGIRSLMLVTFVSIFPVCSHPCMRLQIRKRLEILVDSNADPRLGRSIVFNTWAVHRVVFSSSTFEGWWLLCEIWWLLDATKLCVSHLLSGLFALPKK